ncbi:MAG: ATP-binding protein [Woeseiaceae bacterium]
MIVDFTIKNFRSIKSEQLLSLHADKKPRHHAGNISYIEGEIGVLRTSAIYGSNASGKTNIILAFKALQELIIRSGDLKDGEPIECYEPYSLSETTKDLPTRFEIEFYVEKIRYVYHVEYNKKEIIFEKLDFYPTADAARASNIFTRNSPDDWKSVKFGERYKGGKKKIAFFANNTYLSKAGNTPDSPEVIRKIFNYFRNNTKTMLTNHAIRVFDWDEDERTVAIINTFLKKVDLGIEKFSIEKDENVEHFEFPKEMPEDVQKRFLNELSKKEYFYHSDDNGNLVRFDKNKESSGTNKLFKLLPLFIRVLRDGAVLFVDEIEGSFHPHIAELIIKLFNDPLVNTKNAQLIFTTHDLSLMESGIMRKDQIYLSEKSIGNGTKLYCLESFDASLKDNSPFSKWYDEGRLGAIPKINYHDISDAIKGMF